MKRSRGYFCKQSNVLEEAMEKSIAKYIDYVFYNRDYKPKARYRLMAKVTPESVDEFWNEW